MIGVALVAALQTASKVVSFKMRFRALATDYGGTVAQDGVVAPQIIASLERLRVSGSVEYFYDHYRIEQLFFDGAANPIKGELRPDLSRPGLGLEFKRADAQAYAL